MHSELDPDTQRLAREHGGSSRLRILALWDEKHLTYLLPENGTITVGRGAGVELRIGDPSISREHVRFHVGELLSVEDLGSANGTWVRGRALNARETVPVRPGDMIELGRTMLFVQCMPVSSGAVQIYSHEYFEARVDDECGRDQRGGGGFAVVRTRGDETSGTSIEERLATSLRPGDVLCRYGPGEYELLWVECSSQLAQLRAAALRDALREVSANACVGVASSPLAGRNSASLLERANSELRDVKSGGALGPVAVHEGAMENLRRIVERVAGTSMSVLIAGETGVGKGLLAAELHKRSPRAAGPFIAVNCAGLTESLLEAELFGYEKGAFTGADKAKPGLLETADGGTLLLDEIGEMLPVVQAKMLRVLEDGAVRRLGSVSPRSVDIRLVTCTNRDLEAEVDRGAFRRDLYHRIAHFPLVVPPLRERRGEIEELARAFAAHAGRSRPWTGETLITSEAVEVLLRHPWPGNVRELRNVIERAVVQCDDGVIRPEHLFPAERLRATLVPQPARSPMPAVPPQAPEAGSDNPERQRIVDALAACGGNQRRAAEQLGISRRTFLTRLDKWDLPRPRKRKR